MAIIKTNHGGCNETLFADRVIRVETMTEIRNWSDTLDYTDYRSVTAVYALVWLGTHGVPAHVSQGRRMTQATPSSWDKPRDLEFHEQFAWVDCTNLFSDRNGYSLRPEVDGDYAMFGEPLMWANLIAWEAHHKAAAEKRAEEIRLEQEARRAAQAAEAAKRAAREAKKAAKDIAMKSAAEGMLARIPAKGTEVTVDGFTGKVFWTGASKYRGKWSARAGVKNTRGEVVWVPADKF